jgi:hypothetical protein
MPLNTVTLTGTLPRAAGAVITFTPSNWLTDAADAQLIPPAPIAVTLSSTGAFSVSLLATDNVHLPAGWFWTAAITSIPGVAAQSLSFNLAFANGATQDISSLATLPSPVPVSAYLPVPSGTPAAGAAVIATGSGESSAWTPLGSAAYLPSSAFDAAGAAAAVQAAVLSKVVATVNAGYTLVNGTGTIISWNVPNDGNPHYIVIVVSIDVTSTATGGTISGSIVPPGGGGAAQPQILAGGQGAGNHVGFTGAVAGAGTTVAVTQSSALTGGAATLWAAIFAL